MATRRLVTSAAAAVVLLIACSDDSAPSSAGAGGTNADAGGTDSGQAAATDAASSDAAGTSLDRSFDGLYRITAHKKAPSCEASAVFTDAINIKPYVRLEATILNGQQVLAYYPCDGSTVETCAAKISLFQSYVREGGNWAYHLVAATFLKDCRVATVRGPVEVMGRGHQVLVEHRSGIAIGVAQPDCKEAAEAAVTTFTCESKESFTYEKVN